MPQAIRTTARAHGRRWVLMLAVLLSLAGCASGREADADSEAEHESESEHALELEVAGESPDAVDPAGQDPQHGGSCVPPQRVCSTFDESVFFFCREGEGQWRSQSCENPVDGCYPRFGRCTPDGCETTYLREGESPYWMEGFICLGGDASSHPAFIAGLPCSRMGFARCVRVSSAPPGSWRVACEPGGVWASLLCDRLTAYEDGSEQHCVVGGDELPCQPR